MIRKVTPSILGRDIEVENPLQLPLKVGFAGVFNNPASSSIPFANHMERLDSVSEVIRLDYRTALKRNISAVINNVMELSRTCDLIIIMKGNGIPLHTFQMSKMNCRLYFWMPDVYSHFKNKSLFESSRFCAYRSATGYGTALLWSNSAQMPVYHVFDGTDPDKYYPELTKKKYDVIFIGAADPERTTIYDFLRKKNYNVKFFGPHYTSFVEPDEFRKICSQSKLVLNISRGNYPGYTSLRLWNCMACGSMVLTKRIPKMEELMDMKDKRDIVEFKNIIALNNAVEYYLKHDDEREAIARSGLEFVKKYRTWTNTSEDIIKIATTEPGNSLRNNDTLKFQRLQKKLKKTRKVKGGWVTI